MDMLCNYLAPWDLDVFLGFWTNWDPSDFFVHDFGPTESLLATLSGFWILQNVKNNLKARSAQPPPCL